MKLNVTKTEFIQLYNELTYKQMAEKLNVSMDTIRRYKNMLGLSKKTGRPKTLLEFIDGV